MLLDGQQAVARVGVGIVLLVMVRRTILVLVVVVYLDGVRHRQHSSILSAATQVDFTTCSD